MASGRYSLLYRYSIDGMKTWTDFTDIVDSSQTKVVQQLCSTQCKSIVDKASIVMPAQDSQPKRDFIKAVLEGYEIYIQIFDLEPTAMLWEDEAMLWEDRAMLWRFSLPIFTGAIDRKESTTIKSFPFTPSVSLSLKDLSSLRLDDKVDSYVYLEDKPSDRLTITKVVKHLLSLAGYECTSDAIDGDEEHTLPCFVVDKDNAKTYREYIDTLLFEACGYVLDFDQYGKARIVRLPWDDRDSSKARTIDNPLVADGVSTKVDVFDGDGLKLTWSTLAESSPDQLVYQDSIQRKVDKDTGLLLGVDVPNEGYWPEDGDIQATYQQFSADFLDKPYLIKDSRKRNEDLSIIAVRDVYAYIQATLLNGAKFDSWEYPVLPSLGMESNPTIWPTKAWYLLRNNSGEKVNLQMFTLRGRVMYRAKVNEETVPLSSKKPKEYTSTYIYTQAHAKRFAQFWWHYLNTTRYVTTYTEINRGVLGETVRINHKGVEYGQDAMAVSLEIRWLNHGTKRITSTAVGISAYNEYPSLSTSTVPGRKENGNGISKVEYRYAVTKTQDAPAPEDVTLEDIPIMSDTDKYLWRKETITFTDPSFPDSVSVVLVSVYGDKGKDGDPALVWDFRLSSQTYERNRRRLDGQAITIRPDIQGYSFTPTWECSSGGTLSMNADGSLNLAIPYANAVDSITVTMKYGTALSASRTLSVIDTTVVDSYFGVMSDSVPQPKEGETLLDGDYFIASADFQYGAKTFSKGVPYVLRNGIWTELTSSDGDFSEKMLQCMGGVFSSGMDIPVSATAMYGWFQNLVAQNAVFETLASNEAFIKLLKVYSLFVGTGSRTSGFYVEIADHQEGSTTQEILFNVWFNGSKVFSIDPSTGNIFLGEPKPSLASPASGFMYRKSDGAIVSANEGIIIDKDGVVSSGKGGVFRIFSDFEEGCITPWKTAYLTGTKYEYMDFGNTTSSNAASIGALLEDLFTQYSSAVKTGISAQWDGYEDAEMLYVYADTLDHRKLLLFTNNFSQNGEFTATHYLERFKYTGSSSFYPKDSICYEFGVIDNKLKSGGKSLTWYYNPILKKSDGQWIIPIQPYNYKMHLWGIAAGMTLYGDVMPTGKVWRACFN